MKKIDEGIKRSLLQHQSSSKIIHTHYNQIIDYCFTAFLDDNSSQLSVLQQQMPDQQSLEDLNYSINIISLFIVECFRKNMQQMQLEFIMKDLEFSKGEIQQFLEVYQKVMGQLAEKEEQLCMGQISWQFQKLIDVQIEQRYKIASKFLNNICQDSYIIKLKVISIQIEFSQVLNNKNKMEVIMFECHIEQLTELVHSLEAALKQVSNASQNVPNILLNSI